MQPRYGYIRKNHMTTNEAVEIFEIVDYDNPNQVHAFGSAASISALLGTEQWTTDSSVEINGSSYRLDG